MDVDGLSRIPCPSQKDSTRVRWHVRDDDEELSGCHASLSPGLMMGNRDSSKGASIGN